ncbi:DNA polymerase III subunit gamma/tau [Aestuariispira insulae]|nr:DNA polymerase III subunit gamma/tau [Aestuariispira insulae]
MSDTQQDTAYRVLARKYRPTNFEELVGQEALVRTLSNAIDSGRIAQAFVLTGVRGVGKTTTARIVAKALNCTGPDGNGGPTVSPCGECDNCRAIAEDRHVDVQEMDAASRTGVNDIRELIEGVRYKPVAARYKIYILDEVHMLSNSAFNALLKTLEEPPEHVKFIFATTEIRKVPVTVLSRCQRFDLRRISVEKLTAHFGRVAEKEGITIDDDALAMVARAADGSARDGLSILDQAIALSGEAVTAEQVRDMLGLADRGRVFELFDAVMQGEATQALDILRGMYDEGADPVVVIQDLLDVCYWLTRFKLSPDLADQPSTPEIERSKGKEMAGKLSQPVLTRAWQMLLKGLSETQQAPSPIQAAEMVLIRLIHASNMPTPGEIIKQLQSGQGVPGAVGAGGAPAGGGNGGMTNAMSQGAMPPGPDMGPPGPSAHLRAINGGAAAMRAAPQPDFVPNPIPAAEARREVKLPRPKSFRQVVELFRENREGILVTHLEGHVHLVRFEPGRIEIRPTADAPKDFHGKVAQLLSKWTGMRWMVSLSNEPGEPTIATQNADAQKQAQDEAESDPLVRAVKKAFPSARIKRVKELKPVIEAGLIDYDDEAADQLPEE